MDDLTQRLRAKLIAVPKPGTEPRHMVGPEMMTLWSTGKVGEDAGLRSVGICGMVQEHVLVVDPLCEEAARLIEHRDRQIAAIVTWLEANQPDVFARGLWDAIPRRALSAGDEHGSRNT